jgi:hypothetical protein
LPQLVIHQLHSYLFSKAKRIMEIEIGADEVADTRKEEAVKSTTTAGLMNGTILEAAFVDPAYPWPPVDGQGKNAIELQASAKLLDDDDHTTDGEREAMKMPKKPAEAKGEFLTSFDAKNLHPLMCLATMNSRRLPLSKRVLITRLERRQKARKRTRVSDTPVFLKVSSSIVLTLPITH